MTRRRILTIAGLSLGIALILLLYFLYDPAESAMAPKCAFHAVTGWDCPGCGSQRMIHALLNGDFAEAWSANAFLLCISPLLVLMLFAAATRTRFPRLYAILNSLPSIIAISASLVLWGVLRNIL